MHLVLFNNVFIVAVFFLFLPAFAERLRSLYCVARVRRGSGGDGWKEVWAGDEPTPSSSAVRRILVSPTTRQKSRGYTAVTQQGVTAW